MRKTPFLFLYENLLQILRRTAFQPGDTVEIRSCHPGDGKLLLIFVRYGQPGSAFGTARGKYLSSVFAGHSGTETVFVFSLSVRGLKCLFHMIILFLVAIYIIYGLQN
jgi:hypothetical protein